MKFLKIHYCSIVLLEAYFVQTLGRKSCRAYSRDRKFLLKLPVSSSFTNVQPGNSVLSNILIPPTHCYYPVELTIILLCLRDIFWISMTAVYFAVTCLPPIKFLVDVFLLDHINGQYAVGFDFILTPHHQAFFPFFNDILLFFPVSLDSSETLFGYFLNHLTFMFFLIFLKYGILEQEGNLEIA